MSPGISVRPPPSITTVSARGSAAIGVDETRSIRFPRISTCDSPESFSLFPSKTRTFWNTTGASAFAGVSRVDGEPSGRACPRAAATVEHIIRMHVLTARASVRHATVADYHDEPELRVV